jgi:hypothetical protein
LPACLESNRTEKNERRCATAYDTAEEQSGRELSMAPYLALATGQALFGEACSDGVGRGVGIRQLVERRGVDFLPLPHWAPGLVKS